MRGVAVRRAVAGLATAVLAGPVLLLAPTPAQAAPPVPLPAGGVTAEALPTVQTDGIVWAIQIVGNTVYAGGRFTKARPAGTAPGDPAEVARHNILAFDLTTGALLPFAPDIAGQQYTSTTAPDKSCKTIATNTYVCDSVFRIKASPDGSRVYVGGDFATVNGLSRQRIAAFDTATGTLSTTFTPALNGRVRGLAVTDTAVYVGGSFTTVDNVTTRTRLAAFTPAGALLPWAPTADNAIWSMSVAPALNRVVIGGYFNTVNSTSVHGLMAVDATTGESVSWATRAVSLTSVVTDIVNDGTAAYASGYNYTGSAGAARFEGRMAVELSTGVARWIDGCYGDTQSVTVMNGIVYSASHAHDCQYMNQYPQPSPTNYQRLIGETTTVGGTYQGGGTALVPNGAPIPAFVHWLPDLNGGPSTSPWKNGPWSLDNNGTYLVVGGEFTQVNGQDQQSLTRFAVPPAGPASQPPRPFDTPVPTVLADGTVRLTFPATYDRDSPTLTYSLLRSDDPSRPVATMTLRSTWWDARPQTMVDRTLPAGASVTYKLRVTDPEGNATSTLWSAAVTGTATPAPGRYARIVLADAPAAYWRLGQVSGPLLDTAAGDDLPRQSGATAGGTGAIADDPDGATTFAGTTAGYAGSTTSRYAPDKVSVETWFRTTSVQGGQLIGWGSNATGTSGNSDRKLYLDNTGRVFFGVSPGGTRRTVNSTGTYRDGTWHHAVGTLGPDGLVLYVDGAQVAADATATVGQYTTGGYWRLGGDQLSGWPSAPRSSYLAGSLDEAAVYRTVLTPAQVAAHWAGRVPAAPTAAATASCTGRACTVDGTGSSSPNGTVTGYAWTFGDGGTATGPTATHTYAADGSYPVTLTITDSANQTATTTRTVAVANTGPTAAFTGSCSTLSCTVDGSASSDPDGAISTYAWAFGDGGTATGATATHAYVAAGTYQVTLTVTDTAGATGTVTRPVVATAPGTLASDAFGRTVTGGWGTADTGGAWTVSSTAANYAVSAGSATITVPTAGATRSAMLGSVSAGDVDQTVRVATGALPAAGSNYVYVVARQSAANTDYRARVRLMPDGTVRLALVSRSGSTTDVLVGPAEAVVPGLTVAAGTPLSVRFQAVGSAPTTLRAKVWAAGTAEPGWQQTGTDAAAAQQAPGAVGVAVTVSASNTGVPLTATVTGYAAVLPQ